MKRASAPFVEIGWLDRNDVIFSSVEKEGEKERDEFQVDENNYVYYDKETGLKSKQTQNMTMPDGSSLSQTTFYEEYKLVDGILFPHVIKLPMGPQSMDFKMNEITVNPDVSDADFN